MASTNIKRGQSKKGILATVVGEFNGIVFVVIQKYFEHNPTMIYISEETAVAMLTPHTEGAQTMNRMQLQGMLNEILISEMDVINVNLLIRICVVGPHGKHQKPPIPERLPEFSGEKVPNCAPNAVQQVWLESESWFDLYTRPFKRPTMALTKYLSA